MACILVNQVSSKSWTTSNKSQSKTNILSGFLTARSNCDIYAVMRVRWWNTLRALSALSTGIFKDNLTHWGRDKMAAISQTTFSNAFPWMKMLELRLNFHWSLFLRVQLTTFQLWFGAVQATSHFLNQWWLVYWRIYASLGLNELIKYHGCWCLSSFSPPI